MSHSKQCFVIMPFGNHFDDYYDVIKNTVTNANIVCKRGDEIYRTRPIINDIYESIDLADFCLADVTGRSPNVNYELGVAHALGKPVILITQEIEDLPFDYKHIRIIKYNPNEKNWKVNFVAHLSKTVFEVVSNPGANIVLTPKPLLTLQAERQIIKKNFENIFLSQSYDLDRINKIYLDDYHCRIETNWKGRSHGTTYFLCHNIVADLPDHITVRKAYDRLNAKEMDVVITLDDDRHLTYYFFFSPFKNKDQLFDVDTIVSAPGYFNIEELKEKGTGLMTTQALSRGLRYIGKEDWIFFPKRKEFSKVGAQYLNHPDPASIGSFVKCEETEDNYVLKLIYRGRESYQQDTGAQIFISSPL